MDFDHENVRSAINEDRLSSLPDELIHQILSCIDSKFAVQTCLLSSRWKLLWTSMPCLNFSSWEFGSLPKFAKFVTHVLSHRNPQIEVTSVKLCFRGAASQYFVRKIANYVFSHNVQELTVDIFPKEHHEFPPCLFSSQSLKHFSLSGHSIAPCVIPKTPWDFSVLTSLHLNEVTLCEDNTYKSVDIFSKCVNLKNLTLHSFFVNNVEVFDIITPQLSNLTLIKGGNLKVVNLVAPQLENLTVIDCSIKNPIAPPGLSTLSYIGYLPPRLSKEGFHSLNKVTISPSIYSPDMPFKEKDARKTINLLQEVHSARFLTLKVDIVQCLSSFPDLVSRHPSPFINLICLNIDSSMRSDAYDAKMSTEARNFLLENSPNATFIMELPEPPPTKAMKQKEAREKKRAKLLAEIDGHMTELQASLELGNMRIENRERFRAAYENLMAELRVMLAKQKTMQIEPEKTPVDQVKESAVSHNAEMQMQIEGQEAHTESIMVHALLMQQILACSREMLSLINQENENFGSIVSNKIHIRWLLEDLPKRQRAEIEANCSRMLEESKLEYVGLASGKKVSLDTINRDDYDKFHSNNISTFKELQAQSEHLMSDLLSSLTTIPTPSTSNINYMP